MNKNLIIAGAVIFVILLGGGGFMLMNRSQKTIPLTESNTQTAAKPNTPKTEKMSLKGLLTAANNQTCIYSDPTAKSSGNVYTSSGKMRGDFYTNSGSQSAGMHMMSDGTSIYTWMDNSKTGYKISMASVEKFNESAQVQQSVDMNKVNYSCSPWTVDPGVFSTPTDITFQDFSKMMEDASKMMEGKNSISGMMQNTQSACNACNSLTGDAQTQCKTALKCK